MPDWLTEELNGIALWQLPLIIVAAGLLGYLATKRGGGDE